MELLRRFCEARRPDEPLTDVLAGIAVLVSEAIQTPPSAKQPVAAYAVGPAQEEFVAACLGGDGKTSCRTLQTHRTIPGADLKRSELPGVAPARPEAAPGAGGSVHGGIPARADDAMRLLLEDPSSLADWVDLERCSHLPLACSGRWVGGVLFGAPLSRPAAEVLSALGGVLGTWLAMCLQGRRTAALCERLAQGWGRLDAAREKLSESKALAAVGEMAAGAAHEINNPLAVISGRAQLMAARAAGEEEKKVWLLIVEQAQRISDILTSLVELANPPLSSVAPVEVAGLLSEAAGAFAAGGQVQAAPLKVDIEIAGDLPAASADRGRIVEVLHELLANAAAAGAKRVVLGAKESPPGGVVLTAADDGPGMDAATLASAFTPMFSRQAAGRRRGLGLTRARLAVEAGGGRMWIHSRPGAGTTVFVQLPIGH